MAEDAKATEEEALMEKAKAVIAKADALRTRINNKDIVSKEELQEIATELASVAGVQDPTLRGQLEAAVMTIARQVEEASNIINQMMKEAEKRCEGKDVKAVIATST